MKGASAGRVRIEAPSAGRAAMERVSTDLPSSERASAGRVRIGASSSGRAGVEGVFAGRVSVGAPPAGRVCDDAPAEPCPSRVPAFSTGASSGLALVVGVRVGMSVGPS
ncbi:hypothetical protein [Streptomyces sp. NPDC060205]|uniref:hypothetical protein n=1 Tax=Streptomyces sp. NPDC060205 TaxID=3347072 RepID=UPI003665B841